MFSDGKCPLDYIDISLFHFLQECMSEAGCLPRSLLSLSGQNGHEFPRRLRWLNPASALAAVTGGPIPPPAAPMLGQGAWAGEWAGTEEAETFQFSFSSFMWKAIAGRKTVVSMFFPPGHEGDHPRWRLSSQCLVAAGLLPVQQVAWTLPVSMQLQLIPLHCRKELFPARRAVVRPNYRVFMKNLIH